MTQVRKPSRSLERLVDLREREVERLTADVASKQAVRARFVDNLARLDGLCDSAGASGRSSPLLSLNCANYKQAVLALADSHRTDLALHDAEMALARQALAAAARRHEVLDQVRERQHQAAQKAQRSVEQKQQDDLAAQVWLRRG